MTYLPITITGSSGGAQVRYTLQIDLAYQSGMQADFSDVRFRWSDQSMLLHFWLETYVPGTSATFWVEVLTIPADPSTVTIYAYYGDTGAAGGSNGLAAFLAWDDFNRASINANTGTWTKYGSNPVIAAGHGDPGIFYETGTWYLYVDNLSTGNIRLYTSSDGLTGWSDQGDVLTKGGSGAWDESFVRDPDVIKVGSTYIMMYAGQKVAGASATTHKIGRATASSPTGPWTKDAGNPVFTKTSNGANEPNIEYDAYDTGREYKLVYTYSASGGTDDVGVGSMGWATSSDSISWTDQGRLASLTSIQDQDVIRDTNGYYHYFLNASDNQIYHARTKSWLVDGLPVAGNYTLGLALGAGGTYDDAAAFAPSVVKVGSTYYMYYQASDGANMTIAIATASALEPNWWPTTANLSIVSNRLQYAPPGAAWVNAPHDHLKAPPYEVYAEFETGAVGAGYTGGVYIAAAPSKTFSVIISPGGDTIALYEVSTALRATHSIPIAPNTIYRIRARVTTSAITVDFYDGTWHNSVLTYSITTSVAFGGLTAFGGETVKMDNLRFRKYVSPEPTYSVGSPVLTTTARAFAVIAG